MINESKVLSATVYFSWFISTHDTMEIYLQRWIAYDKYLLIVLFFSFFYLWSFLTFVFSRNMLLSAVFFVLCKFDFQCSVYDSLCLILVSLLNIFFLFPNRSSFVDWLYLPLLLFSLSFFSFWSRYSFLFDLLVVILLFFFFVFFCVVFLFFGIYMGVTRD